MGLDSIMLPQALGNELLKTVFWNTHSITESSHGLVIAGLEEASEVMRGRMPRVFGMRPRQTVPLGRQDIFE